jgi:hypothetical protein
MGQIVHETFSPISINKSQGTVVHACHPSYVESLNRRIAIQAARVGINREILLEK